MLYKRLSSLGVLTESQVAAHNVLEQPHTRRFHHFGDHAGQDRAHRVEALCCSAHVVEPSLIQENLLYNERRHGLGQLRASVHDSQAQGNDFRRQEEIYHI